MQTTEDPSIAAIIGNSPQILDLKQAVLKVAPRNTTVLIMGETGTGKELFAQALHQGSLRRFKPFVRVNCAAIPETLLESELFGYAEGTFTGGRKGGYLGKFALADGGTVFLDELAELPWALQAKLLRFLEEHEIQRLGESLPRRVNVRVVAATNANLAQLVKYKKFRSDLYYRLNVVTLEIPPLRSRREDIPVLTRAFMKRLNSEYNYRVYRLDADIQRILDSYHWPGNVRELRNILETAFNLHDGGQELNAGHLPPYLRRWFQEQTERAKTLGPTSAASAVGQVGADAGGDIGRAGRDEGRTGSAEEWDGAGEAVTWTEWVNMIGRRPLAEITDLFEGKLLLHLLGSGHNRTEMADILGISRQALYKKLQKYHPEK